DPLAHLQEYFGRTTDRLTLYCWYMGQKWADTDVPWHYALVMFAVTVPLGLHALGVLGMISGSRDSEHRSEGSESRNRPHRQFAVVRDFLTRTPLGGSARLQLVALNVVWPLVFFALPGITVYDGARLFLMVFPLWTVFIGRGGQSLWNDIAARGNTRVATSVVALVLALQSYGVVTMHPVQLSYYNVLVGGLRGASRLGFETTYWGDSVTRSLLNQVQPEWAHGPVYFAPVLHPFQLAELQTQAPELLVQLVPFDEAHAWNARRLVVFRRRADSWPSLTPAPPDSVRRADVTRQGVELSGFYEIGRGAFGEEPPGMLGQLSSGHAQ
ncbi:MAG: hypothetical protein KF861_18440, partial [Planctomycetaceae bacterium]|nr:hypothetical protein [Planctomycetaceae bacterium]